MNFGRFVGFVPRRLYVTVLASLALMLPTAALAGADQIVETFVDSPTSWDFVDPCTDDQVHGAGVESGVIRFTDLGAQGYHFRFQAKGTVDLYDDDEELVGTWSYVGSKGDQAPPDYQGVFRVMFVGPIEYEDGSSAVIHIIYRAVFEKGNIIKQEFEKITCAG